MNGRMSRPFAVACVHGIREYPGINGLVRFYRKGRETLVEAQLQGLPESESGFYGFHIHEEGDCCGEGFLNTGGHYNPKKAIHPAHSGDLPPLLSCNGSAYLAVKTGRFTAEEVLGRSVVIHSGPDDFRTQPAGDAGTKIACGVIRRF